MLTIVIPVKNPRFLEDFLRLNQKHLSKYKVITIDSGGGEKLKAISKIYIKKDIPFWEARKLAYSFVKTQFILNLDCDVIIPDRYIEQALEILKSDKKAGAVSIFFDRITHRGILEFGISIWRTKILREFYDWKRQSRDDWLRHPYCECSYMWRKLTLNNKKLETFPIRAKHLKANK